MGGQTVSASWGHRRQRVREGESEIDAAVGSE